MNKKQGATLERSLGNYFKEIHKTYTNGNRIGAYQVMEKYLEDRKGRKLSLDEINHYMKVAKAIELTIKLQERIDDVALSNIFPSKEGDG